MDLDLREGREIGPRPPGDVRLDFVGDHLASRASEMGKDGGVITGPRPDLQNRLALPDRQRLDARRVQRRLAVVDPPPRVDGDENVTVERGDVGLARRAEAAAGDVPWRRAAKVLARNRGEGGLDARIGETGEACDPCGVGFAKSGGPVLHGAREFHVPIGAAIGPQS